MSTFNLRKHLQAKSNSGDTHVDKALSESHEKAPNAVTNKQLEKDYHAKTPSVLTEKQLDPAREDDAGCSIEGRLNKRKSKFEIKHRNADAYTGNINKLEEKRVAGEKMEDEKYEAASCTNKNMRWWETKTNDGLKLASKKFAQTSESIIPEHERQNLDEAFEIQESGVAADEPSASSYEAELENSPGMHIEGDDPQNKELWIVKKEDPIKHPAFGEDTGIDNYGAFYQIAYDPKAWHSDSELREAVLSKFLEVRPDLQGSISPYSPEIQKSKKPIDGWAGAYNIRLFGDEWSPIGQENGPGVGEDEFILSNFETTDAGGTTMAVGEVNIAEDLMYDDEELLGAIVNFVKAEKPGVEITPDSIQLSADGTTASFAVPMSKTDTNVSPETTVPETTGEDDFNVDDYEIVNDFNIDDYEIVDDMGTEKPGTQANSANRLTAMSQVQPKKKQ